MAGDEFGSYRSEISDFAGQMSRLLSEISERSRDANVRQHVLAPHAAGEGGELSGDGNVDPDAPLFSDPTPDFYAAIDRLIEELQTFVDGDPAAFDEIVDLLAEVASGKDEGGHLHRAMSMGTTEALGVEDWGGTAAGNFRTLIIDPFETLIYNQVGLASEIGVAALAYKEIMERTRAHILDIATQLRNKLVPGEAELDFGTVLWLASAAYSGVAAAAGGPVGQLAWGVSQASIIYGKISDHAYEDADEEPSIFGEFAQSFIPSAEDEIVRVKKHMFDQQWMVHKGLEGDLDAIDAVQRDETGIVPDPPDLADTDDPSALGPTPGDPEEVAGKIAAIKKAGAVELPAVAHHFHQAWPKILTVRALFDRAIGDGNVIAAWADSYFGRAVDDLADALQRTRDYLSESGQNLVTIADSYAETEATNAEEVEAIGRRLEEIDVEIRASQLPVYEPPPDIYSPEAVRAAATG